MSGLFWTLWMYFPLPKFSDFSKRTILLNSNIDGGSEHTQTSSCNRGPAWHFDHVLYTTTDRANSNQFLYFPTICQLGASFFLFFQGDWMLLLTWSNSPPLSLWGSSLCVPSECLESWLSRWALLLAQSHVDASERRSPIAENGLCMLAVDEVGITVGGPVLVGSEKSHLISPDHWNWFLSLSFSLWSFPYMGTCI